ncbi:MAG: CHAT domain-containing protein [Thermoanaerobaculia bacterium]
MARAGETKPRTLEPGAHVERSLAPGEIHDYQESLIRGQFFRLVVEQNHLDVAVRIFAPGGRVLAKVDNAADRAEPLSLSVVVSESGLHRVEIRLRGRRSASGKYTLILDQSRPATPDDDRRIGAERDRAGGDHLLGGSSAVASKGALELYEKALAVFREVGDRREEAATLARMSDALAWQGDHRPALERAEQALALWRAEDDRYGEAAALDQVGSSLSDLGDEKRALGYFEQALALRRADGNFLGQAETLNNIAVARGSLGQFPEAIALYTEALDLARAAGGEANEAIYLKNRASNRVVLGETDRALADFRSALTFFRATGNRREQGITQYEIGNVLLTKGEATAALRQYGRARTVLRKVGDKSFEAFTLNMMGLAHLVSHAPRSALADFQLALELFRSTQDRRGAAMVLGNIGRAHLDMGETAEGLKLLREALPLVRATESGSLEAVALADLARGERAQGDLDAARARVEEALRITESLRESIPEAGMRASFTASSRDRYDLLIDILMKLHAKRPGDGWDAEALRASERARARSLIELLAEAHIDLRAGVDEVLLEKEHSLELQLETRRREEQRRLAAPSSEEPSDASGRALDALLAEYEDVQGRLRVASPRYAALARPQPLGSREIQEQVLDRETVLLEFELGEERSFVWAVTSDTLTSHELPGRKVLEAAARRLYQAWNAGSGIDDAESARRARALSGMLLGPVADQLGRKRLAIVAEGALQYLPFAALPSPGGSTGVPLIASHEVVSLPSATALAALRREASSRSAPVWRVAVLADPVFDRGDPRVLGGSASDGSMPDGIDDALTRSMQETGLRRLSRLGGSRREARSISALAGPGETFVALDFQASREAAMSAEVASARIVHFATHGLLNGRHPELSGVVLSLVDEHGHPKDGFLQARDVYKLRLSADLVVLSACQTALGKDVRGEGLLGLSRGFMYAGAPRIVASLWQVPDRATSELMKHFYEGVLQQGLRPAAALRAAQIAVRREKRWTSPYYWAAFTLQGDWN